MYQNTINFERIRERQKTEGYIPTFSFLCLLATAILDSFFLF